MKAIIHFLILLAAVPMWAQAPSEEVLILENLKTSNPLPGNESQVLIQQVGEANVANTQALGMQFTGILQSGNLNSATIDLQGFQNEASLLQEGLENEYHLNLDGIQTRTRAVQQGFANSIEQDLQGVENLDIELIQIGAGHELIQINQGAGDTPLRVLQQGSPTSIIIEKIEF